MTLFRPLPRRFTRPVALLVVAAWVTTMAVLMHQAFAEAPSRNLATDFARYGASAEWRGVFYRNEKVGFTVGQTIPIDDGFEIQEDGRLQMSLLGARTVTTIHTTAYVDRDFSLRSFDFSLDPGTGGTRIHGEVNGQRIHLAIATASGTRRVDRELSAPPVLALNLPRRLADAGLREGAHYEWTIFDPATLSDAPVLLDVGPRELVSADGKRIPAFRVRTALSGLLTTSWITDTGEVVREQSLTGLETVRQKPADAQAMAVSYQMRGDLLTGSAIVPQGRERILEPRDVRRLRLRISGADLTSSEVQGVGQTAAGDVLEVTDPQRFTPRPADPGVGRYLVAEPFIESDAPEIRAEAETAVKNVSGNRARAERLVRHVNAILEKQPTVGLPSAREVLRTRVGDCNEHTALYVAMARSIGIPSRIAVGLVAVGGAFYYHAWPEVYLSENPNTGMWLPVDPTLNEFPADATHLRLVRGGLDRQAAILPLIGRTTIEILEIETAPNTTPVVVGREAERAPMSIVAPTRTVAGCWSPVPERRRRRR
jgi:transglutaminase-like putative cysteine protease